MISEICLYLYPIRMIFDVAALSRTNMMATIGKFVASRRKALRLTQEELAFQSGLGYRFVREVEGGKPTVQFNKLEQLLAFLGFSLVPTPNSSQSTEGL